MTTHVPRGTHSTGPASGAGEGGPPPAPAALLRSIGLGEQDALAGSASLDALLDAVADQLNVSREEAREQLRRAVS